MRRYILSYFRGLYTGPVVYSQNLTEIGTSGPGWCSRYND